MKWPKWDEKEGKDCLVIIHKTNNWDKGFDDDTIECNGIYNDITLSMAIHGMWGILFMTMYNNFMSVLGLKDPLS